MGEAVPSFEKHIVEDSIFHFAAYKSPVSRHNNTKEREMQETRPDNSALESAIGKLRNMLRESQMLITSLIEKAGVLRSVNRGGAGGIRTLYLLTASQTLSQLSYSPLNLNII